MIAIPDVFSVIVDHDNPAVVFAARFAESTRARRVAIRSRDPGHPIYGAPTRVLKQDPTNEKCRVCRTTEGLWKTTDWAAVKRVSRPEVVSMT